MISIVKGALAVIVVVAAVWLLREEVAAPYAMNLKKRQIADRTNTAFASQETAREMAGRLARANAEELAPLARRFPEDPDLHVIRAANLRLIGRVREAMEAYATAVRYESTPELLVSLAETQLELGFEAEAQENFAKAMAFNPAVTPSVERAYQNRPQKH